MGTLKHDKTVFFLQVRGSDGIGGLVPLKDLVKKH